MAEESESVTKRKQSVFYTDYLFLQIVTKQFIIYFFKLLQKDATEYKQVLLLNDQSAWKKKEYLQCCDKQN